MRQIKKALVLLLYFISQRLFRVLGLFWPKDDRLLLFSGFKGVKYSDNARYLFEKFSELYCNEFKLVWITVNKNLLNQARPGKNRVIYQWSRAGLLAILRARVVFYVSDAGDIPFVLFSRRTLAIQLWHGIPIKHLGLLLPWLKKYPAWLIKYLYYSMYDYWVCSSSFDRVSSALGYRMPLEMFVITGYPRNDHLVESLITPDREIVSKYPFLEKKVILYAPTWRLNSIARFFPFADFSPESINKFLEANDSYLLLRGHHRYEFGHIGGVNYNALTGERIIKADRDMFEDVQDLLPFVDVMISDYSGIWIDYLLLNRPIIFIPYDLEEFKEETGILYNYDFIAPGPKISTNAGLIKSLQEYFLNPEKDAARRECVKKIYHEYEDGLAYRRIYELIKQVI